MKTLTKLGLTAIMASAVAFNASAIPLTPGVNGTVYELGTIDPGQPVGGLKAADQAELIQLISMIPGAAATVGANAYIRSANVFPSLPAPLLAGAVSGGPGTDGPFVISGSNVVINVGAGYTYLIAKWDGPDQGAQAWNISGITGTIELPLNFNLLGSHGAQGMTAWTIWNPGTSVPDGGTTVALLGMALGGVGMARRLIGKKA